MKFLETLTFLDNDVLIPVDRIKFIIFSSENDGYKIKITSDDSEFEEYFSEEDARLRYKLIKQFLE